MNLFFVNTFKVYSEPLILIILILEHTVATACSNEKTIGLLRRVASLGRQLDSISYLRTSEF